MDKDKTFLEGEVLASRLCYRSGRLLELFQWDESNLDIGKLETCLDAVEEQVRELRSLLEVGHAGSK